MPFSFLGAFVWKLPVPMVVLLLNSDQLFYTNVSVCEEGSVDQGFGLMINTLPFTDSNDKIIDKTKSIATH